MDGRLPWHKQPWKILFLFLLVAFTLSLHYMVIPLPHWVHLLHRRLCYFPIVLGGLWFGLRGGLAISMAISAAILPLAMRFQGPLSQNEDFLEIVFYLGIGILTGFLVDRREAERERGEGLQQRLSASERLATLGRMAAGVAHEIRTPLGSIEGAAEILAEDYPPGHPRRPFFDILEQETDRLDLVVEDFLDLGRPIAVVPQEVSASEAVALCFRSLQATADQKGVILLSETGEGASIWADEARLHQALTNLVRNAIQASPAGGQVKVAASDLAGGGLVTVEDEGPGFQEAEAERLFEPFYTRRKDGTGLGLALVKSIAAAHGGWVKAENGLKGGARFSLWLQGRSPS